MEETARSGGLVEKEQEEQRKKQRQLQKEAPWKQQKEEEELRKQAHEEEEEVVVRVKQQSKDGDIRKQEQQEKLYHSPGGGMQEGVLRKQQQEQAQLKQQMDMSESAETIVNKQITIETRHELQRNGETRKEKEDMLPSSSRQDVLCRRQVGDNSSCIQAVGNNEDQLSKEVQVMLTYVARRVLCIC